MQVLSGQVRSNLWVRNGQSMAHKVSLLHENVQMFESFDLDIAFLQSCAGLCRALGLTSTEEDSLSMDLFVSSVVHRFGLMHFFNWTNGPSSAQPRASSSGILQRLSNFFIMKKVRAGEAPSEEGEEEDETQSHGEFKWMRSVSRQQQLLLAEQCLRLLIILANERGIIGQHSSTSADASSSSTTLQRRPGVRLPSPFSASSVR